MKPSVESSALAVALLALFWFALPVTLPRSVKAASHDPCVVPATDTAARAIHVLEQCRVRDPQNSETLADLGAAYESIGDRRRAETAFRQALELDQDYADVRLKLSQLLLDRGEFDEAAQQAGLALRTQPNRRALLDVIDAARSGRRAGGR